MSCSRKLYAYIDAKGQVLGEAPFDGCSRTQAMAEVMLTYGPICIGCSVVPLTPKLERRYRRMDDTARESR